MEIPVPADHAGFIYPFEGSVEILDEDGTESGTGPAVVTDSHLAVLGDGNVLIVRGGADGGRFILVAGQPIHEPIARYGPFVMNTREEIAQAVHDFQSGNF